MKRASPVTPLPVQTTVTAPGPSPLELLRSLPRIQRSATDYLLECAAAYGDVVHFQAGSQTAVLINHPEGIQHVLQDNHRGYSKDTIQYRSLSTVTGTGLLTSDGEHWLRQRRLAQPAFARSRLPALEPFVTTAVERVIPTWDLISQADSLLEVDEAMLAISLEIVGQALFHVDLARDAAQLTQAVLTVLDTIVHRARQGIAPPASWPTPRNLRFRRALRTLDQTIAAMIADRKSAAAPQDDLLGMYLSARDPETGAGMTVTQLRDEVITLLIAGHETVASALSWTWVLLAGNPSARAALENELDGVLAGRPPRLDDLPALPYTRAVFEEALRLYPPAWLITRKSLADDEVLGYKIPAGSLVILSPYTIHRHPAFWEEPEAFRPERFLIGQTGPAHRFAYIPFGAGPRLCIGNHFALLEAHLIIARLAQRYRFDLPAGARIQADPLVTIRPRGGLKMRISLRKGSESSSTV